MPGEQLNADLWVSEYVSPYDVYLHGITYVYAALRTRYQDMQVVESGLYGKALVLDGKWQSCVGDEFMYHEPLVQVACTLHKAPKRVLVLGGGEGATVREALKWNTVNKVAMVDIDGEVVDACKTHLAEMHQGAFDDPRTELIIGDALDFLDNAGPEWDIIISDLSDPIEQGPSFKLFTKEYFTNCKKALKEDGYFVLQAGPVSPPLVGLHARLASTVRAVFDNAISITSTAPSYGSQWGFVIASSTPIPSKIDPDQVNNMLERKTNGKFRMFDGVAMQGLLHPPKYLREAVANETTVYTLKTPPSFTERYSGK